MAATVRGLPLTLQQNLNLFCERVAELLAHPLVRDTPLRAPSHFTATMHYIVGIPLSDPEQIKELEERVSRETLYGFLRILRFFELQGEPTSMRRIVEKLKREPVEDTMRRAADASLQHFELTALPPVYRLNLPDGVTLTPSTAFDLYMNGEIFHGVPEKRNRWTSLKASEFEPILYSMLLQAAVFKAQAVLEFYRLLRVHGHVDPVPGDPTLKGADGSLLIIP
jgi:hypothetical protein